MQKVFKAIASNVLTLVLTSTLAGVLITLSACNSHAHDGHSHSNSSISLSHAYTYETPPSAPVAGGYITIKNTGKQGDTLLKAEAAFAGLVELHTMSMKDGIMKMTKLKNGIDIPAGEDVVLKRGGKHIMFMQLSKGMKSDRDYKVSLYFKHAGKMEIYFKGKKLTGKHEMNHKHQHSSEKHTH